MCKINQLYRNVLDWFIIFYLHKATNKIRWKLAHMEKLRLVFCGGRSSTCGGRSSTFGKIAKRYLGEKTNETQNQKTTNFFAQESKTKSTSNNNVKTTIS
jgi:hypothetical protein